MFFFDSNDIYFKFNNIKLVWPKFL
jgi:hypothetical protein